MKTLTKLSAASALCLYATLGSAQPSPTPYGMSPFSAGRAIDTAPAYFSSTDHLAIIGGEVDLTLDGYLYFLQSNINAPPVYSFDIYHGSVDSDGWVPSPAIAPDGTAWVVNEAGILSAFNQNGTYKSVRGLNPYAGINLDGLDVYGPPAIGLDGSIYINTDDNGGVLYCIDPDLALPKWKCRLTQPPGLSTEAASAPVFVKDPVSGNSCICIFDENGYLHFVTPYGQDSATPLYLGFPRFISPSPAVTPEGLICIGTDSGSIYIVDPFMESVLWYVPLGAGGISASPVVGSDRNVYIGTTGRDVPGNNNFFAIYLPQNLRQNSPYVAARASLQGNATTAAVGAETPHPAVYVGDSEGFFYSLQMQAGGTFQNLWAPFYATGEPGFVAPPLLAMVGQNHATPVVYAGCSDGNLYAFNASAGPSTGTWSTFQGNAQRTGAWGTGSITPSQLINVQFYANGCSVRESGKAAYGNGSADYWNPIMLAAKGTANPFLNNLTNAAGLVTQVGISVNGILHGCQCTPVFSDNMMHGVGACGNNGPNFPFTVTISGLSAGINPQSPALYDIYLYGYGGQSTFNGQTYTDNTQFSITPPITAQDPVTGNPVTSATTASSSGWSLTQWIEGDEYVVFRSVPVSSQGQAIVINGSKDPNNPDPYIWSYINGLQIVARQ